MNTQTQPNQAGLIEQSIGEFVAEDYRTAAVFKKYGIDFCCGGQESLTAICQENDLNPEALLRELADVKSIPIDRGQNFAAWELPFLIDYIVNTHHAYLYENTDTIEGYTKKIAAVHGSHHPEVVEIAEIFAKVAKDLTLHLQKEEETLFPAIKRIVAARKNGNDASAEDLAILKSSLETLHQEHEEVGAAIHAIHRLSRGYEIPENVCNTFVVTYRMLQEFEDDLHKHVHLENNLLFPKAAQHG